MPGLRLHHAQDYLELASQQGNPVLSDNLIHFMADVCLILCLCYILVLFCSLLYTLYRVCYPVMTWKPQWHKW